MLVRSLSLMLVTSILVSCGSQKKIVSNSPSFGTYGEPLKPFARNILIVGSGSMASQAFLDELSATIIKSISGQVGNANYLFLEKTKPGERFNSAVLDTLNYDAFIIFHPVSPAQLQMSGVETINVISGNSSGSISGATPNAYRQAFALYAYSKKPKLKLLWETGINLNFDLMDERTYNSISKTIIGTLAKQYISFIR